MDPVAHKRPARCGLEHVVVTKGAERAANHHVGEASGAIERVDASPKPLADAEVTAFELDLVAEPEEIVLGPFENALTGVAERLGVESHVPRQIEANLRRRRNLGRELEAGHGRESASPS